MKEAQPTMIYINYILIFVIAGIVSMNSIDMYIAGATSIGGYCAFKIGLNKLKQAKEKGLGLKIIYIGAAIITTIGIWCFTYYLSTTNGCQFVV